MSKTNTAFTMSFQIEIRGFVLVSDRKDFLTLILDLKKKW